MLDFDVLLAIIYSRGVVNAYSGKISENFYNYLMKEFHSLSICFLLSSLHSIR